MALQCAHSCSLNLDVWKKKDTACLFAQFGLRFSLIDAYLVPALVFFSLTQERSTVVQINCQFPEI